MKNYVFSTGFALRHRLFKYLLIMKFVTLLILVSIFQVQASTGFAQTVNISKNNVSIVEVFREIKKQTDYTIISDSKFIKASPLVSIDLHDISLDKALNELLPPLGLSYDIKDKAIIIKKATKSAAENKQSSRNLTTKVELQRSVSGRVTDQDGVPLIGVSVVIKGKTTGTTTNDGGQFSIAVQDGDVISFSYIGFDTYEVTYTGQSSINPTLIESIQSINEIVIVGYGSQKRSSLTAAVSTLDGEAISQNPVANVNNSIAGRVPGVLSFQTSGEPGADAATLRVRGISTIGNNSGALTIVDGVPRDFSQINPNEIESISVLKDAAAIAPYGLGGANGVILITTKRGKEGTVSLSYNSWFGTQRPTRYPKYLDAYGFATTLNAASINAGLDPFYTDEELQAYKNRIDLDHYPDHDWVREVIDFKAPMTSHNLSFSGGSEKIRFFSSLGYLYQQGSVRKINYSRYNLASNIDFDATPTTLVSFDIKGSLEATKNPGSIDGTGIYTQVTKQPPLLVNQLQYTNGLPGNTLLPSIYESGYNNGNENTWYTQLSIEQKISAIPGLSLKAVGAYDKNYTLAKQWQTPYSYYTLNSDDEFVELKGGVTAPRLNQGFRENVNITLQGYINYENTFGDHHVSALAVAEQRTGDIMAFDASRINYQVDLDELSLGSSSKSDLDNSGSSSSNKQLGFVYRLSYDYAQKYLAELSGRYDGHYYFAPGERFAFFPAASLGWRLSEESFIKDNFSWIDNLKLRASYGKSGNLAGGPFQYLSSYGLNASYIFGGSQVQGVFERPEPNVNITWETAKKVDVGLEASFMRGRLGFEIDFFKEKRSDMLVPPTAVVPVEYGIGLSQVNGGIMENKGLDFSINTMNNFSNGLRIDGSFNISYAKNKLVQTFENASTFDNPNRRRTGRAMDTQFGLRAIGLFQSEEEIASSAKQFGTVQPGDIRYEDVNNDGVINNDDEVVIGLPAFPQIIYGLNGNFSWKGFDLKMLWQGAAKSNFLLTNEASNPFFNGAKIFEEQLDYWTPDNRDATYPIILPSPNSNSSQVSSWWIRDGAYLRLKNLEFGYTIPAQVMEKMKLNSIRLYAAGQNLLTFSAEDYLDPEIGLSGASRRARYYFQQKVLTFGLNVNF